MKENAKNKDKVIRIVEDIQSKEKISTVVDYNSIENLILKKLGTYISMQRKQHSLTQKDLNKLSHVSLAVIADLENGKSMPRVETLIRLACAMGIDINEIFEEMKCVPSRAVNNIPSSKASLASSIAGFGYDKNMVNEIMDFISYIEHKYSKVH